MEPQSDSATIWVFTPSRNTPEELEAILVQRRQLLEDAVERVRESALTGHKHHQLFVGPRGSGKTFLASLIVHRAQQTKDVVDRLRVAWLNEDETCTTLLEFLLKIHAALGNRYPNEFPSDAIAPAYEMPAGAAQTFVGRVLIEALASRTVLVVVENLDALFETLGKEGQHSLRAFIQENPRMAIVATAQRLVEDLSSRAKPFFGFFQTEYLKPLNLDEATELLRNIARLNRKQDVVDFLDTRRGRSRIRALHHLSGGNHRIYIVLSHFITKDSIDALVGPFMKMVDELTPYYQERIRWLSPLQRRIVELLCRCEGPVPVKELAKRLFGSQQTISRQLQELREKGYVEANARGREMLYEVSEPLMRICVEVKENSVPRPLRLLVDFLRAWYDEVELCDRFVSSEPACIAHSYLKLAMERNKELGNLRRSLLIEDYQSRIDSPLVEAHQEALSQMLGALPESALLALECWAEGRDIEGNVEWDRAFEHEAKRGEAAGLVARVVHFLVREAWQLVAERRTQEAVVKCCRAVDIAGVDGHSVALSLFARGVCYNLLESTDLAMADWARASEVRGVRVDLISQSIMARARCYLIVGNAEAATVEFNRVIDMPDAPVVDAAEALFSRGAVNLKNGHPLAARTDWTKVIEMIGVPAEMVAAARIKRGLANWTIGEPDLAVLDWACVIDDSSLNKDKTVSSLLLRGLSRQMLGNVEGAKSDFDKAIELSGEFGGLAALATLQRGLLLKAEGVFSLAEVDFGSVVQNAATDSKFVLEAALNLTEIRWLAGRWKDGFVVLETALDRGSKADPKTFGSCVDLLGVLFSAGLSPTARQVQVAEMIRTYARYQALPSLGEGLIRHIGKLFQKGAPFPSTDNLVQWQRAWEQGAAGEADFQLPLRLLRVGIAFVSTGGADPTVLLELAAVERSILRQALGLEETE